MILERTRLGHINGSKIENQAQNELVFCFVRHPLTWLRSYWQCKQQVVRDRRGGSIDTIVDFPFNTFVDLFIRDLPGYISAFFAGYTDYSHFVGKQENLREDLNCLLKYLHISYNSQILFDRPRENVIPSVAKFTIPQALKIMELEQPIIQKFKYNYIPMEVIA